MVQFVDNGSLRNTRSSAERRELEKGLESKEVCKSLLPESDDQHSTADHHSATRQIRRLPYQQFAVVASLHILLGSETERRLGLLANSQSERRKGVASEVPSHGVDENWQQPLAHCVHSAAKAAAALAAANQAASLEVCKDWKPKAPKKVPSYPIYWGHDPQANRFADARLEWLKTQSGLLVPPMYSPPDFLLEIGHIIFKLTHFPSLPMEVSRGHPFQASGLRESFKPAYGAMC
ncbi:hypothetical protein KIN20_020392 [Parelaphostrongylus tenuis]|uniref:Uncharacterized protein n=1 Tax=Parelaphostrongylus tenuis TaxID=148309 RepID=A0AAD5QVI2_PARTN|nr:hypothetical protein KIN20_020392 [Parelaphostrongylus tenuis]